MSAPLPLDDPNALASIAGRLMAAKLFSLASCVMLFYDILITFGDEVENIWKKKYTFATVLWTMNRYLNPLGYIIVIVSFNDPNWGVTACDHYVLFPEVLKIFTAAAIGTIFIFRLYSLYGGSLLVLGSIGLLLIAELAVKIWAFTDGTRLVLPPGLVGCILTGKDTSNDRFVFTWVAELIFDTAVFIATLSRTLVIYRRHRQGAAIPLIRVMMRDGIIYFLVIFAANVVTVTLFIVLPPDLKAINASFSTLITSLMVSRLILNLRNQASRPHRPKTGEFSLFSAYPVSYASTGAITSTISQNKFAETDRQHLVSTIIGNLGEPVEFDWFDDPEGFETPAESAAGHTGRGTTHGQDSEVGTHGSSFDCDSVDDAKQNTAGRRRGDGAEQYELTVARTPIVVEVTVTRAESAVSRAEGALPRYSLSSDVRSIKSNILGRSILGSASTLPGTSTTTTIVGGGGGGGGNGAARSLLNVPESLSPGSHLSLVPPPSPLRNIVAPSRTRMRTRPGTGTETGPTSAWRPPQTWNLEGVEIQELGLPRKASRRPRTS